MIRNIFYLISVFKTKSKKLWTKNGPKKRSTSALRARSNCSSYFHFSIFLFRMFAAVEWEVHNDSMKVEKKKLVFVRRFTRLTRSLIIYAWSRYASSKVFKSICHSMFALVSRRLFLLPLDFFFASQKNSFILSSSFVRSFVLPYHIACALVFLFEAGGGDLLAAHAFVELSSNVASRHINLIRKKNAERASTEINIKTISDQIRQRKSFYGKSSNDCNFASIWSKVQCTRIFDIYFVCNCIFYVRQRQ